nr:unnamed protein product [Callosobruchus chinensis]
MNITEDDRCIYCGETDTAEHTLFHCPRWIEIRELIHRTIGETLSVDNVISKMVEFQLNWEQVQNLTKFILKKKEKKERETITS